MQTFVLLYSIASFDPQSCFKEEYKWVFCWGSRKNKRFQLSLNSSSGRTKNRRRSSNLNSQLAAKSNFITNGGTYWPHLASNLLAYQIVIDKGLKSRRFSHTSSVTPGSQMFQFFPLFGESSMTTYFSALSERMVIMILGRFHFLGLNNSMCPLSQTPSQKL